MTGDLRARETSRPELEHASGLLRLLADPTRLAILQLLCDHESSVSDIAESLGRPLPVISQHLAKLRTGHLVTARRDGRTIYYAQSTDHVGALVSNVLHHTEHVLYPEPPHHRT